MMFPLIITFVLGLVFGSFASVVIHRLHSRQKGIVMGRSKCPKCENTLTTLDLVPLFSYLWHHGACRFCKKKISVMYPLLEAVMASSFALTTYLIGVTNVWYLAFYLLITFIFVTVSFYDGLFQEIPDEVMLPAIVFVGLVMYLGGFESGQSLAYGFTVPVLFFGFLFFVSRGNWLGGGDLRIGALMGLILGWPNIIVGLFLGYLLGSIYSAIGIVAGKLTRKSHIPFAPFLFLGTYITIFWGGLIMQWYLGLIG